MRLKVLLAAVGMATASMAMPSVVSAATTDGGALWGKHVCGSAISAEEDCGSGSGVRSVDDNGFCVIDEEPGGVALGVQFTSDRPVLISGVRVYRVDVGDMTGSLWTAGGTLLATGTFTAQVGHGWQDLHFATPVPIEAGTTYVASYLAPNTDYAFEWDYFADKSATSGPITALRSTENTGNGVYCCVGADCDPFPSSTYRNTNYWVSPIRGSYGFTGFESVDETKLNTAKAGSAIPVKFSLGGDEGMEILTEGYPKASPIACESGLSVADVDSTVTAGASKLTYDLETGRYIYVWRTSKAWEGCHRFDLGLNDGSVHTFDVKFK